MHRNVPASLDEVISFIAVASIFGRLGLFVGTGFSKAATAGKAPNFAELIDQVSASLKLNANVHEDESFKHSSHPQIASRLLALHEKAMSEASPPKATYDFKETIATICNLKPDAGVEDKLRSALEAVRPAWLVTTNYDLLLETLMEKADSVLPGSPLVPNAERPPIYHLHGDRRMPSSIKITEEDYVDLLAPFSYQHLKLPLLFYESTTVILGYSLGDVNVRVAIGWSRAFEGRVDAELNDWEGAVIHAVRTQASPAPPYREKDGRIVVEIEEIGSFLEQIGRERTKLVGLLEKWTKSTAEFLNHDSELQSIKRDDKAYKKFLGIVENASLVCQPSRLIDFIQRVLDPIWVRARSDGKFDVYADYLDMVVDVLAKLRVTSFGPSVVFYLGDCLDRVGQYYTEGKTLGDAWRASDVWRKRRSEVKADVIRELDSYAKSYDKRGLKRLLAANPTSSAES